MARRETIHKGDVAILHVSARPELVEKLRETIKDRYGPVPEAHQGALISAYIRDLIIDDCGIDLFADRGYVLDPLYSSDYYMAVLNAGIHIHPETLRVLKLRAEGMETEAIAGIVGMSRKEVECELRTFRRGLGFSKNKLRATPRNIKLMEALMEIDPGAVGVPNMEPLLADVTARTPGEEKVGGVYAEAVARLLENEAVWVKTEGEIPEEILIQQLPAEIEPAECPECGMDDYEHGDFCPRRIPF